MTTNKSPFAIDVDQIAADGGSAPKEKKVIPEVTSASIAAAASGHHFKLNKTYLIFFAGLALVSFALVYFLGGSGNNTKAQLSLDDTIPSSAPAVVPTSSPTANVNANTSNSNQNSGNQNGNANVAVKTSASPSANSNSNSTQNQNTNVNRGVSSPSPSPSVSPSPVTGNSPVPSPTSTFKAAAGSDNPIMNSTPNPYPTSSYVTPPPTPYPAPTPYPSPTPIPVEDKPKAAQTGPMAWAIIPAIMALMWRLVRRKA